MPRYKLRGRHVTAGSAVDVASAPRDREYKPSRLLELPAELRIEIYSHALEGSTSDTVFNDETCHCIAKRGSFNLGVEHVRRSDTYQAHFLLQ